MPARAARASGLPRRRRATLDGGARRPRRGARRASPSAYRERARARDRARLGRRDRGDPRRPARVAAPRRPRTQRAWTPHALRALVRAAGRGAAATRASSREPVALDGGLALRGSIDLVERSGAARRSAPPTTRPAADRDDGRDRDRRRRDPPAGALRARARERSSASAGRGGRASTTAPRAGGFTERVVPLDDAPARAAAPRSSRADRPRARATASSRRAAPARVRRVRLPRRVRAVRGARASQRKPQRAARATSNALRELAVSPRLADARRRASASATRSTRRWSSRPRPAPARRRALVARIVAVLARGPRHARAASSRSPSPRRPPAR